MNGASEESRPDIDVFWQEVCEFLGRHPIARRRTIAPREFGAHLRGSIPYAMAGAAAWPDIDCIVIHKGWIEQLPAPLLHAAVQTLAPAFANAVFVVYCRGRFEPLGTDEHVRPLLEKIPAGAGRMADAKPRPLLVYAGKGRMICRDPEYRKIVAPTRDTALIGALMAGHNPLAGLREAIRPAVAGARRIVDYGAGIGLFALAAKDLMAEGGVFLSLESDADALNCLVANIDLAGMYWRTEFLRSRPSRLRDLAHGAAGGGKDVVWAASNGKRDLGRRCDALHIDLDFGLGEQIDELALFIVECGFPAVVLSRGLANRRTEIAESGPDRIAARLRPLGYKLVMADPGAPPAPAFAEIALYRRPDGEA